MKHQESISQLFEKAKRELESAEILLKAQDYDGSASRSYYAMYHSTQAVLLTMDLSSNKHSTNLGWFNLHFIKTGVFPKVYGKSLGEVEKLRKSGDYGYPFLVQSQEAEEAIEKAKEFVRETEKFIASEIEKEKE